MADSVHYEAEVAYATGQFRFLEVHPFSNDYQFPCEQAAIDAAHANDGKENGYRITKVTTSTEVVEVHQP